MSLPAPAIYFPIRNARYEVAPGLHPLGRDFGNGSADALFFQLDQNFTDYRRAKEDSRRESLDKYFQKHELSPEVETAAGAFIAEQFAREHPQYFHLEADASNNRVLHCSITSERLKFDRDWRLVDAAPEADPPYACALDALCSQIQEDAAITVVEPSRNWLAAMHLCFPNHWSPAEKIGKDFNAVHEPVASFGPIARSADTLLNALMTRGPFVRFAWGLATDTRLNHHPDPPPGVSPDEWRGRGFDQVQNWSEVYMRIERQVITRLPSVPAFLFLIRTYFRRANELDTGSQEQLRCAIHAMTEEEKQYKGLLQIGALR